MEKMLIKHGNNSVRLHLLEDNDDLRHDILNALHAIKCSFILTDKGMTFIVNHSAYSSLKEYLS